MMDAKAEVDKSTAQKIADGYEDIIKLAIEKATGEPTPPLSSLRQRLSVTTCQGRCEVIALDGNDIVRIFPASFEQANIDTIYKTTVKRRYELIGGQARPT